ncbi:MAG: sulfur carrier protein ThiS [Butyrivibrio sp.]|nr:sulfur carrier protein ThiS [Butyrivibrio sp.]
MKITVAGETKEVKEGITIAELIELEKVETPEYVTVSVNESFADKNTYATQALKEGDTVEFLYCMGGGAR